MKLLLAEDTRDLNRAVSAVLTHEGYRVDSVYDGTSALEHIRRDTFDVIILDIMMPGMSGLEVLTAVRKLGIVTPVLLLTARAEVDDRVAGLDAGADDYLTKPFAMKELLARIWTLTRRHQEYTARVLEYRDISLATDSFELKSENSIRLSARESELMQVLILNADRDLDTAYLIEHIWENDPAAGEDTVWLYISYLRGKLQAVESTTVIIGTRGGSFRLAGSESTPEDA